VGHAGLIWRGGIYQVQFGHEVGQWRPAVVVSADIVNQGPGLLVMVVPISTAGYGLSGGGLCSGPDGGATSANPNGNNSQGNEPETLSPARTYPAGRGYTWPSFTNHLANWQFWQSQCSPSTDWDTGAAPQYLPFFGTYLE